MKYYTYFLIFFVFLLISCFRKNKNVKTSQKNINDSISKIETAKIKGIYDAVMYDSSVKLRTTYDIRETIRNKYTLVTNLKLIDILPYNNRDTAIVVFRKNSLTKNDNIKKVYFIAKVQIGSELWDKVYKRDTLSYEKLVLYVSDVKNAKINPASYEIKTLVDHEYFAPYEGRYGSEEGYESYNKYEVIEYVDYYISGNLLWISGLEINRYLNREELHKIYKLIPNILFEQSFDEFYRRMESGFERKYIYKLLKDQGLLVDDFESFEDKILTKPAVTVADKMRKIKW